MIENKGIQIQSKYVNEGIMDEIKFFFTKVNERALFQMGIYDTYDNEGDEALAETVEYFHPAIVLDDRMRYIMENIVTSKETYTNIICNTIISHFYGARGIHQIITRDKNPKTALVDFDRLLIDEEYRRLCEANLVEAKSLGMPIYGSTELRTSLFGSANAYVAKKYNIERNSSPVNILLWVAGFIERGIVKSMYKATSLKEMFKVLTTLEGVGSYYGYHCSTSNSVNPAIDVYHDERFCIPGPGARKTIDMMFTSDFKVDYGDAVIWFRENYKDLIGDIFLHPSTHNVVVNGNKIFKEEQDTLKTYGCEVGLCQFGVYKRLKENPHLINRRKVARLDEKASKTFFEGTAKIEPIIKKEIILEQQSNEITYITFEELKGITPVEHKSNSNEIILDNTGIVTPGTITPKVKLHIKYTESAGVGTTKPNLILEVKKPKPKAAPKVPIEANKNIILELIEELGVNEFSHGKVSTLLALKGNLGLNQDSNWKESWMILQYLVSQGILFKEGTKYIKNY